MPHDPSQPRLSDILARQRAELMTIDPATLLRPRVTRERVRDLTAILLDSFAPMRAMLTIELSPKRAAERTAQSDRLEERALAFYAADIAAEQSFNQTTRQTREALAKSVAEHDRELLRWARPLFADDPEITDTLSDISRGHGRRDDAEDVVRLVSLYRNHWNQARGKTPITQEYLDSAEADATRQLDLLAANGDEPALDLARRAYTAWHRDYDELKDLGRYLARGHDDAARRFPGVMATRRPTQASPPAAESPDAPADTPADVPADAPGDAPNDAPGDTPSS